MLANGHILYGYSESKHDYVYEMTHRGWHPPHPSFIVKKAVYDKYGVFDLRYQISADFELMFRLLVEKRVSVAFTDIDAVVMREGGTSQSSIPTLYRNIKDSVGIIRSYGYNVSIVTYSFFRIYHKLFQYSPNGLMRTYFSSIYHRKSNATQKKTYNK
jgi:hypothetical protein